MTQIVHNSVTETPGILFLKWNNVEDIRMNNNKNMKLLEEN